MPDKFEPEQPASLESIEDVVEYVGREIRRISQSMNTGRYDVTYVEPEKPREGDVRYADGTQWAPPGGIGKGLYLYDGDIWRPIG